MHAPPIQHARTPAGARPHAANQLKDGVKQPLAGQAFTFNDLGPATVKGFDDPVPLFAVADPLFAVEQTD